MDSEIIINQREQKIKEMTLLLRNIDDKLLSLCKEFNWDYKKLLEEKPSDMAACSFNSQHKVPFSKIKVHEEKCLWSQEYANIDEIFPEYSGVGSCVTLTPDLMHSITQKVSSSAEKNILRPLPQTSANFDQNFSREEKLAIYDYVIAHTQNQKSYSDLCLQPVEKTKEKKEMAAWEIAAAERDAKRRRASYRNKVHTNRKTHTEILREVIESQMEAFELDMKNEKSEEKAETPKFIAGQGNSAYETAESSEKSKYDSHGRSYKEGSRQRDGRKNHDRHSKYREHRRSPPIGSSDSKSGSRSDDKYRKWKTYEGRSHFHRSSRSHRR